MNIFPEEKLRIVTDHAILRQPSRHTSFRECLGLQLFDMLQEAMKKAWAPGIGLSAVQIGQHLRCAFYRLPGKTLQPPVFLINPTIMSGTNIVPHYGEACLSLPDKRFTTWRFDEIVYVKDVNDKPEEHTARGLEAHVIQHEVDHMNGVLCCDRTNKPKTQGRNEPCACGSGAKFKKCCEAKGVPA